MTEPRNDLPDLWSEELAGLDRITFEPGKLAGKACIRGMRISAGLVTRMIAGGMSREEIIQDYPYLEDEDITQALRYASLAAEKLRPSDGQT